MNIAIHAGHNPAGKTASGAAGYLIESVENRLILEQLKHILIKNGHIVTDATVNDGASQTDILKRICERSNNSKADLCISIHFNAGGGQGCECLVYQKPKTEAYVYAENICASIADLGFTNRGVKKRGDLYVLNHTAAPCIIVECCFVDSIADSELYSVNDMAAAIARGLGCLTEPASETKPVQEVEEAVESKTNDGTMYVVSCGVFSDIENAKTMKAVIDKIGISCAVLKR